MLDEAACPLVHSLPWTSHQWWGNKCLSWTAGWSAVGCLRVVWSLLWPEVSTGRRINIECSHSSWSSDAQLASKQTLETSNQLWLACSCCSWNDQSEWCGTILHLEMITNNVVCYQLLPLEPFGICCSCCRLRYVLQVLPGDERWIFLEVGVFHACHRPIMIIFVLFRLRKCSSILAYKHPILNPHLIFFILISFLENNSLIISNIYGQYLLFVFLAYHMNMKDSKLFFSFPNNDIMEILLLHLIWIWM